MYERVVVLIIYYSKELGEPRICLPSSPVWSKPAGANVVIGGHPSVGRVF